MIDREYAPFARPAPAIIPAARSGPGWGQALRQAIEALAADPFPRGAKKLRGEPGLWRLRVGGWRVVYTVEADRLLVLVLLIGGRGDMYERLKRRLE